jgi:hypothetical protein
MCGFKVNAMNSENAKTTYLSVSSTDYHRLQDYPKFSLKVSCGDEADPKVATGEQKHTKVEK